MENKIVLADTSILIDYFRKSEKSNSTLVKLYSEGYDFFISAITEYEIYSGATSSQLHFWSQVLNNSPVISFDRSAVKMAVQINKNLKLNRKQIDLADLFIAATAVSNNLPIATLNKKHFERIDMLTVIG